MAKAHAPAMKIMSSHTHHSCTCTQIADLSDTAAHSRMCGQHAAEATLNANKQTVCAASAWAFLLPFGATRSYMQHVFERMQRRGNDPAERTKHIVLAPTTLRLLRHIHQHPQP
jgi:hypothetical protein